MWCIAISEHVLVVGRAAAARRASSGPRARSNGRRASSVAPGARAPRRRARRQAAQVRHRQRQLAPAGAMHLHGPAVDRGERRAQRPRAGATISLEAALQRGGRRARPSSRSAAGHVVDARCPARAGRGTRAAAARTRAAAARRAGRAQMAAAPAPCRRRERCVDARGQLGHGRRLEERAQRAARRRSVCAERAPRPASRAASGRRARRSCRATPDPLDAEHLGPDRRRSAPRPASAARDGRLLDVGRPAGVGQRPPVDLAVGGQRQRRQRHERRRAPCTRAACAPGTRAARRRHGARRVRRRRTPPAACSPVPSVARHHDRLAHRRVPRSAASISPSSIAEAADLDLVVEPAEELERAVRRASARGRRSGRVRPPGPPPNGSGTKRSAVSSGRSR